MKKDLIPRIVINDDSPNSIYLGFVHKTSEKPSKYFDFVGTYGDVEPEEKYINGDIVYKISPLFYFNLSLSLLKAKRKYNLMMHKHMLDETKYGKFKTNNNQVGRL